MEFVKLKDLCKMQSGGTPSRSVLEFYEGTIPWAKISDLETSDDGYIYNTEEHITDEALKSINNRFFKVGTLLLAMYGSVGKTAIAKIDLTTNQAILGINIIDEKILDIKYLRFWFTTIKQQLLNRAVGGTLQNISLGIVKELDVPLPPLPVQQKIAAILDAADELRQKDKILVAKYDELTQALFLDMFGNSVTNPKSWPAEILGALCGVGSGKRVFVEELVNSGIPFFRGTEIGHLSEGYEIKPTLFITKDHYDQLKVHTGVPQIGDLLMPSICPDGRILRVSNNQPFYFKDGRVLWIKVDSSIINSFYLKALLKSIFSTNYSNIASGSTFAELKIVALKNVKILTPPLSLQNQFEKRIATIENQKNIAKVSAIKSEELFNSLLQKAFNGELI